MSEPIETYDFGAAVLCDDCSKDYTASPDTGGILFQSKALGPCCAPRWEASAEQHGESHFIRARCPEGKPFAAWVLEDIRKGDNTIRVYGGVDSLDALLDLLGEGRRG